MSFIDCSTIFPAVDPSGCNSIFDAVRIGFAQSNVFAGLTNSLADFFAEMNNEGTFDTAVTSGALWLSGSVLLSDPQAVERDTVEFANKQKRKGLRGNDVINLKFDFDRTANTGTAQGAGQIANMRTFNIFDQNTSGYVLFFGNPIVDETGALKQPVWHYVDGSNNANFLRAVFMNINTPTRETTLAMDASIEFAGGTLANFLSMSLLDFDVATKAYGL